MSLVVVPLAAPTIPLRQDGTSVVFAVDESASMSEEMKRDAQQWVQEAMKSMSGQDRAAVVTFGRDPQVQRGLAEERGHTFTTSQFDDSSTSIERALRVSRSLLSNAGGRRIILITDGAENAGDARQEARLAAADGVEVSSVVIPPKTVQPEVLVQALEAPSNVRDGEDFDLTVTVNSTVKQPAVIRLWLDNKGVGLREVDLEPGATRFTVPQPPLPPGYHAFRLTVEALQDTQPNNNVAFTTSIVRERPRVLLIEGKDGDGKPIAEALSSSGIDVDTRQPKAIPNTLSGLRDYQSIVLFDVPATGMTLDQMKTLEQYPSRRNRHHHPLAASALRQDTARGAAARGRGGRRRPELIRDILSVRSGLPLHIILLAEMVADLDQHHDAFGIAGLCDRRLVGGSAELPAVAVAQHRDDDAVRTIDVSFQLGPRHRNQLGFGLGGLAHGAAPSGRWLTAGCRFGAHLSRGSRRAATLYRRASTRVNPTICGSEPVWTGSLFAVSGGSGALAVASGKRIFISRRKPSSVSTLAAIFAITANSALLAPDDLPAVSKAARSASPLISGAYFSRKRARPMASSASA